MRRALVLGLLLFTALAPVVAEASDTTHHRARKKKHPLHPATNGDLRQPASEPVNVPARSPVQPPAPTASPAAQNRTPSVVAPSLSFDLLGPDTANPAVDPAAAGRMENALHRRRVMLQLHTFVGLALVVATTANVILGSLNYFDRFQGGGYTNRYNLPHEISAFTSFGLLSTNLILGLAAPSPFGKPLQVDRMLFHRIFMFTAAASFVAEIVLGFLSVGRFGQNNQPELALAHVINGYTGSACIYAGALVLVF